MNDESTRNGFAAFAMQGMLAHPIRYKVRPQDAGVNWHLALAREAFAIADAMIEAGQKTT